MRETMVNKVSRMTDAEIVFAMDDIQKTLTIWRDEKPVNDPYIVKLYVEFDAILDEKRKRLKKPKCPTCGK